MAVVATITTITLMFFKGGKRASLLDPKALRKAVEKLPKGEAREESLKVVALLDGLARQYELTTESNLEAYTRTAERWDSSASSLAQIREPADRARVQTLLKIVDLRESLLRTLTPQQWEKVFGKPSKKSSVKGRK